MEMGGEKRVAVTHPPKILLAFPACGMESPFFDHAEERVWSQLVNCRFFTFLHSPSSPDFLFDPRSQAAFGALG